MKRHTLLFLAFFIFLLPVYPDYPEILHLDLRDVLFRQLQSDIASYYSHTGSHQIDPLKTASLIIYRYKIDPEDDIITIAAHLNIWPDTIATLNRMDNSDDLHRYEYILIPNIPGIFVPLTPESALEDIMYAWRIAETSPQSTYKSSQVTVILNNKKTDLIFFIGEKFHPIERAYYLQRFFRFPLAQKRVTSPFGHRMSPFGGHPEFHNGIDLGAREGTPVYAAANGIVAEAGYNSLYGNYIVIEHHGGFNTVYGHLSEVSVQINQEVSGNSTIGKVGSTGYATGPHLHFEIRRRGVPTNPLSVLEER